MMKTIQPENRNRKWAVWLYWTGVFLLAFSLAACSSTPAGEASAGPAELPAQNQPAAGSSPGGTGAAAPSAPAQTTAPAGASPAGSSDPAPALPESPAPAVEKTPESAEVIQVKWQEGPHAQTYVLDEAGKNDTCARCHAPVNWIPSMDDMPESCYACKFEVEPPPPVIAEVDWTHVECKICHTVKKKEIQPEIAWLEIAQIEQYAAVASATELCQKCHTPVEVAGHGGTVSEGAHAEMACSDCHDAHAMTASCGEAGCHETLEAAGVVIDGHDADHVNVSCGACHDASGLEVGPDASGMWVTFDPQPADPVAEKAAITAHNTVKEAPCERCHFAGNPWNLELVEAGTP